MPPGFHVLIAAQFCSALADNALLIVTIALLQQQGLPGWWAPLLKFAFTLSYVFLAPVVGPLADAFPKGRLMAWMNGVKVAGVVALLAGVPPVLAFVVVGFGAAAYAPAKYGLVTEIVPAAKLVEANGWIEVSVVLAALLGTVLGGLLVRDAGALDGSLGVLLIVYVLAGLLNGVVPVSSARYARRPIHPVALLRDFAAAQRTLWADRDGALSMAATTLFWGVGATLQFAVLRWAIDVMGLTLERAAYLQAAVAVGVVAGAVVAGRCVPLARARRVLPAGIVLGALVALGALCPTLWLALPLFVLVGAVGGLLVVPLNALLQHRGHVLLSAGRSIAVQGFNENLSILVMLAGYAALLAVPVAIVPLMIGFGLAIGVAITLLIVRERRRSPPTALPRSPASP
ncbi:MAG: lysophospholipid transporter LplT [Piscinibacter sp.]|nr:lysophospholipid transporter LplT [Piscinibacter sp.]